jgi:hypothetical protein
VELESDGAAKGSHQMVGSVHRTDVVGWGSGGTLRSVGWRRADTSEGHDFKREGHAGSGSSAAGLQVPLQGGASK